ncbi:MAG: HEPN domain-containing protein [Elusimicrobiota bacterium]
MARITLAKYRIQKATEILKESEDAFKMNHLGNSLNRSYYAMFTAARSLLALKELDSSKHSGIIALFNQHIIKTGLFPRELSQYLQKAKRLRENADYGDFVKISHQECYTQIIAAKKFIQHAEESLLKLIKKLENNKK